MTWRTWCGGGLLVAWATSCAAPAPSVQHLGGEAFGTTWTVQWLGGDDREGQVREAVVDTLKAVDRSMSTWRPDSELQAVRDAAGPVVVGEDTALVVGAALDLARATGGAFDPTVQPLMELWGFHGAPREHPPTDAEVEAARAMVGWERVIVARDGSGRPTIDARGTALDLSAIAKGHAVDRLSHALSALGLADHFVEVGGEVRGQGHGLAGARWRVGVELPEAQMVRGASMVAVLEVINAAVATSGDYRNTRTIDGQRVAHTMDPRAGRPASSEVLSATVVAPDCRTADGWATAIMVLGTEQGLARIEAMPDVEALVLQADGDGFVQRRTTGL